MARHVWMTQHRMTQGCDVSVQSLENIIRPDDERNLNNNPTVLL